MFNSGGIIIIGLNILTAGASIANLVLDSESLASTGRPRYKAGLAFGLAHYPFVPIIASSIRDIVEDRSHGESTKDLKKWIDINLLRMLTVDCPAGQVSLLPFLLLCISDFLAPCVVIVWADWLHGRRTAS
ncbi:hypothetical protein BP5796_04967 [Coleophoma crateriformis]|uniref:Uncharacterized protein n=1 Tax=Coleophoma crateriformis TaxID=565419 RepID=A0A3D8SAZ7_9HELO|nr:hypothetical protein BP5796_04967 [Coleophoma crateriformis]